MIASMSMAWAAARRTRTSLNGELGWWVLKLRNRLLPVTAVKVLVFSSLANSAVAAGGTASIQSMAPVL